MVSGDEEKMKRTYYCSCGVIFTEDYTNVLKENPYIDPDLVIPPCPQQWKMNVYSFFYTHHVTTEDPRTVKNTVAITGRWK